MKLIKIFIIVPLLFTIVNLFEIKLDKNPSIIIFKDGKLNPYFNYSTVENYDECSINKIYYEHTQVSDFTRIQIAKNENETFSNSKIYVSNNNTMAYTINNSQSIDIFHLCKYKVDNWIPTIQKNTTLVGNAEIIDIENKSDKWSLIRFEFLFNNQTNYFDFIKICEPENPLVILISVLILLLMAVIMTYVATSVEIKNKVVRDVRDHSTIQWYHGLIFALGGSAVLIIMFYFIKYLNIIYSCLVTFQCLLCCYYTINHIFKTGTLKQMKILRMKIFKYKMYTLLSISLSVLIVLTWYITRNWALNNILAFTLAFVVINLFTIKNFKTCIIILVSIFIYDSFWVFYSTKIFSQNVMVTVATNLDLPIKIQIPLFFINNPVKNCMILGLGDIILPGLIIKYCRRFDKIKNTLNYFYFRFCMTLYIASLVIAFLAASLFNHAQPVLFYIAPIFIWGLITVAFSRSEYNDFMNGFNNQATQAAVDQIINGEFTRINNGEGNLRIQTEVNNPENNFNQNTNNIF